MIKKFERHLKKVFIFCPKTVEMLEFKEELLGILMEKYEELVSGGMSEKEAYKQCILSIDDYKDTIKALEQTKSKDLPTGQLDFIVLGSFAYLLLVVLAYFISSFVTRMWSHTWVVFIFGVVLYAIFWMVNLSLLSKRKSRYFLTRIMLFLSVMLYSTLVYLIVSFMTLHWHYTWLIFIGAIFIWFALDILFRIKNKLRMYFDFDTIVLSVLGSTLIYLSVSFATGLWGKTWLIFLGGVLVAILAIMARRMMIYKNKVDIRLGRQTVKERMNVYKEKFKFDKKRSEKDIIKENPTAIKPNKKATERALDALENEENHSEE